MTTLIDVIDSAVKIGLGACIAGVLAYVHSRAKHKDDIEKMNLEDRKSLLREAALKVEEVESKSNDAAYYFHSNDLSQARSQAKAGVNTAYSACALVNLAGSQELLDICSSLSSAMEDIYHELNQDSPKEERLCELDSHLSKTKKKVYVCFRNGYSSGA